MIPNNRRLFQKPDINKGKIIKNVPTWLASVRTDIKSLACLKFEGVKNAYEVPVDSDRPVLPILWM